MRIYIASGKLHYLFILSLLLLQPSIASAYGPVEIKSSTTISNDGSFTLSWEMPDHSRIELQQAAKQQNAFNTIFTGADSATVITGLPDGDYLYRARLADAQGNLSEWSPTSTIKVQHHSISRALSFFLVGAIVFAGTLLLIVLGGKASRQGGKL